MSKIYEALEHAKQKIKHTKVISSVPETLRMNIEGEMIQLHQAINSILPDETKKIIQFIGSLSREGTSTVTREFASTLALRLGKNVLLLDADPDLPSQHIAFSINVQHDMRSFVKGSTPLIETLYRVEDSSLFISVMSVNSPYGSDLFDSPRIDRVWEELRKRFDIIIIDSPPANLSPIGFSICRTVGGVVLVIEAEKTRWPVINSVKERIMQNGGKIIGIVFNKRKFYIPGWIYRRL